MPYTAAQLTAYYTLINQGIVPDAATTLLLNAYASQDLAGTLTDAQTLAKVVNGSQAMVGTDVAAATYNFFTGTIPSAAGLAFLVNSTSNTTDLNDTYYTQFNQENRYYNFAINLALVSSSAAAFSTTYSALTLAQTISTAYETIIGSTNVGAAAAAAAIASITAAIPYFQSVAATRAAGLNQDLATKAIIIGYIIEEGIKADVGTYAKANDQFLADVAGGVAIYGPGVTYTSTYLPGQAGYGIGIGGTGSIVGGTPGSTFAFTGGIDNLAGTVNDDTFNATVLSTTGVPQPGTLPLVTTLQAADTAVGGGGNDTLNISILDPAGANTGNVTVPAAGISGIRNIFVRGVSTTQADIDTVTTSGFTGAIQFVDDRSTNDMRLNNVASGVAVGLNGAGAAAAALNLSAGYTATATAEIINLTNGVSNSTLTSAPTIVTIYQGTGAAATTMVTATINSSGAANTIGALQLNGISGGAVATTVTTLNVAANAALTTGVVTGIGSTTGGATETFNITGNSAVTFAGVTGGGANVATMNLNVNTGSTFAATAGLSGLFSAGATLNVSGSSTTATANTASVTLGVLDAGVKTLNASGLTAGGVNVTIGANTGTVFTGGAGTDIVTIGAGQGAALTGAIAGGAGTDIIAFSTQADLAASLTSLVTGFETLRVSSGAGVTNTYDPTLITGITAYQVATSAGSVILNNLPAAGSVTDIGTGTVAALTLNMANAGGATDALTLTLNNGSTLGSSGLTVTSLTLGGNATAGQIETLNLVSAGKLSAAGTYNNVTLAASGGGPNFADPNTVVITGSVGLTLTNGVTAHSIKIDGSAATGSLNLVNTAAVTGIATLFGGSANDTINSANTATIIGGSGGDSLILGGGTQTVQYTKATDSQLNLGETDATTLGANAATATTLLAGATLNGTVNTGSMDILNGFVSGTDKIDLTAFVFGGALQGVADAGTATSDSGFNTILATAGIFTQGANVRAVTQIHGTAAMSSGVAGDFLVIDVNKDGVYTAGTDMVIKLQGVASVVTADFLF